MRLVVPWAMLVFLGTSAMIAGPVYRLAFWGQIAFLSLGVAGAYKPIARRSRLSSAIYSFLVLNAAAWIAFWVWASGRSARSWTIVTYRGEPPVAAPVYLEYPRADRYFRSRALLFRDERKRRRLMPRGSMSWWLGFFVLIALASLPLVFGIGEFRKRSLDRWLVPYLLRSGLRIGPHRGDPRPYLHR